MLFLFIFFLSLYDANENEVHDTDIKMCHYSSVFNTLKHQYKKFTRSNVPMTYQQQINALNAALDQSKPIKFTTFNSETDIRRPFWLYTFFLFNSYTYCNSTSSELVGMSLPNADILGGHLWTGRFKILSLQNFQSYFGPYNRQNSKDAYFMVTVNKDMQLITLAWRGTRVINDYFADLNGQFIKGFNNSMAMLYSDANRPVQNLKCKDPKDSSEYGFFSGFLKTLNQNALDSTVKSLKEAYSKYPGYSIVITGHSLGGLKALLIAFYITKFYSKQLPISALYTYGQPIPGNLKFGLWLADCIGPEKIVRVVVANDLVPWGRASDSIKHATNVIEVWNGSNRKGKKLLTSLENKWVRCMGPDDARCSAGIPCQERDWNHHSVCGGIYSNASICLYSKGTRSIHD